MHKESKVTVLNQKLSRGCLLGFFLASLCLEREGCSFPLGKTLLQSFLTGFRLVGEVGEEARVTFSLLPFSQTPAGPG